MTFASHLWRTNRLNFNFVNRQIIRYVIRENRRTLERSQRSHCPERREVEQLRIKYLSKKGEINALMADFRNVPGDQKKEVGIKINELKNAALEKINGLKEQMEEAESSSDDIDLTRTAYPVALGTRHPLTVVKNQIIDIFGRMGFTLYQVQR